jgi:hypothetical protein
MIGIPSSIMDFGYGNGSFLRIARKLIPNCYGYDVSNIPVPEHTLKIEDPLEVNVNTITFFDSLEHCRDLGFVKKLKCRHVVISVPDCHFPENDQWFASWKHRRPDEHLWHFNRTSLENFMNDSGYYLVRGSHIEDMIRKNPLQEDPNILTAIFKKKVL